MSTRPAAPPPPFPLCTSVPACLTRACAGGGRAGRACLRTPPSPTQGQSPFTYDAGVNKVIKGWDFGCLGMKLGETRRLSIPAEEGYGAGGFPAWGIPPNGSLDFEIEVSLPGTLRCTALRCSAAACLPAHARDHAAALRGG